MDKLKISSENESQAVEQADAVRNTNLMRLLDAFLSLPADKSLPEVDTKDLGELIHEVGEAQVTSFIETSNSASSDQKARVRVFMRERVKHY